MNPIAFNIFGFDIRWYGIIIGTAIIMAVLLASYTCRVKEVNFDTMQDMILISLPMAIIGARLYYVIFNWEYYRYHSGEIFNIRQGGLAIHGGVILGVLSAYIIAKRKKIDFLKYADAAAPCIILAQAMGRWGNFFNQEAHGGPVSYSFIKYFPFFIQKGMLIDGQYYNPTFFYESLWNLLCAVLLLYIINKFYRDGTTFFTYIAFYSIGRFVIEGMRTDSLMFGPFRIAQLVSLLGVLLYFIFLFYIRRDRYRNKT